MNKPKLIDPSSGLFLRDIHDANRPLAQDVAPGPISEGFHAPKWTGTWDAEAEQWVGGEWVEGDPDAETKRQAVLSGQIKAKARLVILSKVPDWKQSNLLARKAELQDVLLSGDTLTADQQVEWDYMLNEWNWIKAVREASNQAEADGTPIADIVWPTYWQEV